MQRHPMEIDAFVLLPDHLHSIWTLPEDDHNFSIAMAVSQKLLQPLLSRFISDHCFHITARQTGNGVFWQRRFWEHMIRDRQDFISHVEYIHYNPVKHGLVNSPKDW